MNTRRAWPSLNQRLLPWLLPVSLFALWWLAARNQWMSEQILPAPALVWSSAVELAQGELWSHLWISQQRLFWGLLGGVSAGALLGAVLGFSPRLERLVFPTFAGLAQVPNGLRQAAQALGMRRTDIMLLVELPLAWPLILAGVKTAAVMTVGTATIAAFIGAGGYGERIAVGLALNDNQMLLAGAIPSALLALVTQGLFELAESALRRRGAS